LKYNDCEHREKAHKGETGRRQTKRGKGSGKIGKKTTIARKAWRKKKNFRKNLNA